MISQPLRVVIADDESHLRYIVGDAVRKEGMIVVGEAADGQAALDLYRLHKPDLLLLDVNMPVRNGDEVLFDVLKEFPDARVIMLTMVADAEVIQRCLGAGALNYILKSNSTEDIRRILRETFPSAAPHHSTSNVT